MAAKQKKLSRNKVAKIKEMSYEEQHALFEAQKKGFEVRKTEMEANNAQGAWADAAPIFAKDGNGALFLLAKGSTIRGRIFDELCARSAASEDFARAVEGAINIVKEAFPSCEADEIEIKAFANAEIAEDGTLRASAEIEDYDFLALLKKALFNLRVDYVGQKWNRWKGDYEEDRSWLWMDGSIEEYCFEDPNIEEDVATFTWHEPYTEQDFHHGPYTAYRHHADYSSSVDVARAIKAVKAAKEAYLFERGPVPEWTKFATWIY